MSSGPIGFAGYVVGATFPIAAITPAMTDPYYFSVNLDDSRVLCIAPLSNRRIESCPERLDDISGYFLFETDRRATKVGATKVLARLISEEAAFELSELLNMR